MSHGQWCSIKKFQFLCRSQNFNFRYFFFSNLKLIYSIQNATKMFALKA